MTFCRKLVCFILLHLVSSQLQINLDQTDWVQISEDIVVLQHNCLHVVALTRSEYDPYQIISYCMSAWLSRWNIQENIFDPSFTFAELYKRNITSQQLYRWSAPMDLIENYQFYLNQLSISKKSFSSLSTQVFYNCTLPRFGPFCQYSLDISMLHDSSLSKIIDQFYHQRYEPTSLTCYTYLHCDHGSTSICLDWTEICDGTINCLNDGIDEEHCWQLTINECNENEYRCQNGECISKQFVGDNWNAFDCIDQSDERFDIAHLGIGFSSAPTFRYEDVRCSDDVSTQISFTSSCVQKRHQLIFEAMFLNTSNLISDDCRFAFRCNFGIPDSLHPKCHDICLNKTCEEIINESCPDLLFIPDVPILFGHIYLVYTKQAAVKSTTKTLPPSYICYDNRLCGGFYPDKTVLSFNHTTCRRPEDFPLSFPQLEDNNWMNTYVKPIFTQLYKCKTAMNTNPAVCENSIMYQCINSSKCISKYRIGDGLIDCDYEDDEEETVIYDICLRDELKTLFKCTSTKKCIHHRRVNNGACECGCDKDGFCDDEATDLNYRRRHILFRYICDGITELLPVTIDGQNQTDETECELWQCNNTYTRCTGIWNCLNGADEVDCEPPSSSLECPPHHHICVSIETHQPICLPIEKANDGRINCVGGADETKLCKANHQTKIDCQNYTSLSSIACMQLCYQSLCRYEDDEQVCYELHNFTVYDIICADEYNTVSFDKENVRRSLRIPDKTQLQSMQVLSNDNNNSIEHTRSIIPFSSAIQSTSQYTQRCHRGIPLLVWTDRQRNLTDTTCLCPPSFYGITCQYQNQRVSLTVKFQACSDSQRIVFAIVVTLIDDSNERIIHSYEQFSFLYNRDCYVKYNIYLLYSTRPKNHLKHYSVHIDIYEKISLTYRGSLLLPLKFPFLPVHRIAVRLNIPCRDENNQECTNQLCIHGKCTRYAEDSKGVTFCHCDQGWSGRYCNIPHICICSPDSLCVGISANNRSICICPLNKFGSRCLLHNSICQSNQNKPCFNGGTCIPDDEHTLSTEKFFCICPKGFSGRRCEIPSLQIILSFHKDIQLPQSIIMHFIDVPDDDTPRNGSTFKMIPMYQDTVTIHWLERFNIALMQLFDMELYLVVTQDIDSQPVIIKKTVSASDRCRHLNELLNDTIINLHLIRRIKYYHIPCQQTSPALRCFFDDTHFCMCNDFGHQRVADCFEFDYQRKLDCFNQNYCENGAQCLQDKLQCPKLSICACPRCFYGIRCQFTSSLFGLSLDAILGYHIQPHMSIRQQPSIVKMSVALTIIMTIAGLINGVLSVITFKNKKPRDLGCDYYLLGSSITSLFTMSMFALKFWILMITQMTYSTNRVFLNIQCISIDFLLRISLNMDQWLYACVAIERAITAIVGLRFDKRKSKQMAKYIIPSLLFMTIITTIHDPIHRRLIYDVNDDEEKRIWCIVTYSSDLQIYNSIMNVFHFITPFSINLISAFIIIKRTTRLRNSVHPLQNYRQTLFIQIQRHRYILIGPVVLIILAIPRLILSLVSGCMKSFDEAWASLIGYFVSFIPSILTFVVFILPSKSYKKEFRKTIRRYRTSIKIRLNLDR